jgi:dihydrofolate reductase
VPAGEEANADPAVSKARALQPEVYSAIPEEKNHHERKDEAMKLATMTQVTVDGVMQGNGGASDEDRKNGFERGGWARGVGDNETMTFINQTYQRADAFLFGRRTYELFAGYWGAEERARAAAEDPSNHPIAAALNTKPKYLASTTLTEPRWANTTVLSGDLAAAIGELKAQPTGELQVHGSGALSDGCSKATSSTRSTCSSSPWSSARACGYSPRRARTWRSTWLTREPTRRA